MELILPKLIGLFGVVFLFGFAVFIHELGHFLAAKFFGVGVSKFAIGFGPKMVAKQWGETEYSIRWIPLGGFVSLKGMVEGMEEPEAKASEDISPEKAEVADAPESGEPETTEKEKGSITEDLDALRNKPAWQRIVVFGSGVTMNFLLAIFLVAILLFIGEPASIELPNALERVPEESKLYELGWRTGDRIVDIQRSAVSALGPILEGSHAQIPPTDKTAFHNWGDVIEAVNQYMAPQTSNFRTVAFIKNRLFPQEDNEFTSPTLLATVERAGEYLHLPVPPSVWADPEELQYFSPPRPAHIGAIIPSTPAHRARLVKDNYTPGEEIQPYPTWDEMKEVPLKPGDYILEINHVRADTWGRMSELLRANPNNQVNLTVRRTENGNEHIMLLTTMLERDDSDEQRGRLGVYYSPPPGEGRREGLPLHKAILRAPLRTLQLTDLILYETVSVFARSPKEIKRNVGGPIVIGIMAYREAQRGLYEYLKLFAMICIVLSVMNLLPIPILDGGYIAITLVEGIIGRPLPRQVIEPLLTVFFILFMFLFAWIFFNDIMNWVFKQ